MTAQELSTIQPPAQKILRAPRRRSFIAPPSKRNLAIFKMVAIEELTHEAVAQRFQTSRGRVSQIVADVRRRLAQAAPDDPDIQNRFAQQRLESHLEKMRYQHALHVAAKALQDGCQKTETRRQGTRDRDGKHDSWDETTLRVQPVNAQVVRAFFRAAQALGHINQREIENNPYSRAIRQLDMFEKITQQILDWRSTLHPGPDAPSQAFVTMVVNFEFEVRGWINRCRRGIPPAEAWPVKEEPRTVKASRAHPFGCANQNDACANHTYDEIDQSPIDVTATPPITSESSTSTDQVAS